MAKNILPFLILIVSTLQQGGDGGGGGGFDGGSDLDDLDIDVSEA